VALWLEESLRPGRLLLEQQCCLRERLQSARRVLRLQDPAAA
jgi:hypothetical protein